jgi:hypothetical protein
MGKQPTNHQHKQIQPTNTENFHKAVQIGQTAIKEGKTKADAVRMMFPMVFEEPREVIWQAFIDGAGLTDKGAVTYLYNVRRAHKKGKLKAYFEDQP